MMTTIPTSIADTFSEEVTRLRAEYQVKRQKSNVFPPAGRPILDMELVPGEEPAVGIWYEDGTQLGQYVRLFDLPETLSGNILRLERALPAVDGHVEIKGDVIRGLDECPNHPAPVEDDFEDVSDLVAKLPIVAVDSSRHFTKKGKYRSEIENLLKCQGGSCPRTILSPHLIHLLGASRDGELVFEKLATRGPTLARFSSLDTYKRWILHIVDALSCLHSLNIVHRDLRIDNCLFADNGSRLVVCDLESRWGQRAAPEIAFDGGLDSGWTTRSDIYDIGNCIKCMVYANAPITNQVEWPVPQPLQGIVEACMRKSPDDRPTLLELREMVEAIPGCRN
ncbi:kinase-like domain-containing protein [Chaetomium fimeti]|uniref:EKC/KEOPS complex subunit BUD32 n=1 Tax=Chaetomium fimeti TaxID=1854472 RepID=A0AAE0LQ69_9PEZI|nr:kinase-like domain-containing protein [Chaetomium fimeti]